MKKLLKTTTKTSREVMGIIIPNAWDLDGRATGWAISTYNEKIYQIEMGKRIEKQLPNIMGKKVKVHGVLKRATTATPTLKISDFAIIEEADTIG
jgi:hypothetical protein